MPAVAVMVEKTIFGGGAPEGELVLGDGDDVLSCKKLGNDVAVDFKKAMVTSADVDAALDIFESRDGVGDLTPDRLDDSHHVDQVDTGRGSDEDIVIDREDSVTVVVVQFLRIAVDREGGIVGEEFEHTASRGQKRAVEVDFDVANVGEVQRIEKRQIFEAIVGAV